MSPDDVLAASLWNWPDPLLKRDRAGHVMFVNAAFLGLYGGRVQDWQGKPVTGWPAPSIAGPQRFETRAGGASDISIYDWVETPMADGNVLAIARNVTAYANPTPPPPQDRQLPPSDQINKAPAATEMASPAQNPSAFASAQAQAKSPDQHASVREQAKTANPVVERVTNAAQPKPEPAPAAPKIETPPSPEIVAKETAVETAPQTAHTPQKPASAPAPSPMATETQSPEPERTFERRALPIEDSTSVLGANWRDQVIAKAVGAEAEPAPSTPERTEDQEDEENHEGPTSNAAKGLHILLAEDNSINALLTRTLLEAEGATVDTVEDGALALEAVKKTNYDLIFMDMRMPNMDGLEATRKIRAYGATLPIIALTANAFDDDRNACFDSGMNDFMTKPVSAEELVEMVTEWTKPENRGRSAA
ncbi:MAG TPA: response regulator [Hellea balneolensis]|uniref:Response regulator n=2 Tax=Hellea balneolensis TaxID=287478 RepID=A0A7C5R1G0_9PROT|nr:response regulator [Hellea balneolensis]